MNLKQIKEILARHREELRESTKLKRSVFSVRMLREQKE